MNAKQNYVVNPHDPSEDEEEKKKKENPERKPDVIIMEDHRERRDGPGGE